MTGPIWQSISPDGRHRLREAAVALAHPREGQLFLRHSETMGDSVAITQFQLDLFDAAGQQIARFFPAPIRADCQGLLTLADRATGDVEFGVAGEYLVVVARGDRAALLDFLKRGLRGCRLQYPAHWDRYDADPEAMTTLEQPPLVMPVGGSG